MSGNMTSLLLYKSDPISRKTMRYAIGMVIMFAIVFTYNWPASFLIIIFGHGFLLSPKPTLKFAFDFVSKFVLSYLFSVLISYLFLDYYVLYILIIGLIMLHIYYADSSVLHPILKVAMCIMNMLVPLMSLKSLELGATLGMLIVIGTTGAVFLPMILHALIPDLEPPPSADQAPAAAPAPQPSKRERFYLALKALAVLYPLILAFFFFNMQSDVLILVYISLFAAVPGFAKDLSIGKVMIKTTFYGGLIAFLMYEILVLVPLFSFFMLMIFGLALFAGHQLLTEGKYALTIKKGFSAVMFIFGGAANSGDIDVEGKIWLRVIQMTILVLYLILAFNLLEKWFPQTDKKT
jgi:hypothetical protein